MDLFRRIGTQKKKFKIQFFIGRLKFSQYRSGKVYIVIKRGNHKVKSQQKLQMSDDNKLNFNKQIIELEATLYFDQKENKYQQKLGEMSVVLLDQKNNKILLGTVPIDLSNYANSGQQSVQEKRKLQQTPKKLSGLIQFNVFIKYIGEGSQSSADKVSDFFFGKTKEQAQNQKIKQKNQDSVSVRKKQNKSLLKPQKQKSQAKDKVNIKPEFIKYKVSQSKQKVDTKSKSHKNKKQLSEGSDNQQESSNQNKVFYFDEPSAQKQPKVKEKVQIKKNQVLQRKSGKQKIQQVKNKNNFHYDVEDSTSQIENIETSEVQAVEVNGNFGESHVESINSEPIKSTTFKTNGSEKNFVKNRSKVQVRAKNIDVDNQSQIKVNLKQKQSKYYQDKDQNNQSRKQSKKVEKEKQKLQSRTSNAFEQFYSSKQQKPKYQKQQQDDDNFQESSPGVSPFMSPNYVKQTSSFLMKQNDTNKRSKRQNTSFLKKQQLQKNRRQQSDLTDKYIKLQSQNETLKVKLRKSQQIIQKLENQKKKSSQKLSELSQQIEYYQSELKQKQDELQNFQKKNSNQDETSTVKYIQEIKRIQRQKNQLIVENSKLKEKYKKDFSKFQQILSEKQSKEQESLGEMKIQIQILKQQNSSFREKIEKLTRQKDQKTSESNKQKNINKNLDNQLNEVKDSLSKIKLKICNMLNDALSTGQQSEIQLLMELNKN